MVLPRDAASSILRFCLANPKPCPVLAVGEPGDPALIGIADITRPDYGDPCEMRAGESPVFWACDFTPQAALEQARLSLAITHAPGCMLVTDLLNQGLAAC